MKKILTIGLSLLFAAGMITACQGKATEPSSTQNPASEPVPSAQPQLVDYNKPEHQKALDTVRKVAEYAPRVEQRINVKSVSANISAADAERAVLYGKPEIRLCYTNAYVEDNKLIVESDVRISLDASGKINAITFDPAIENQTFAKCIDEAVKKFRFPTPKDGQPATIDYAMSITSRPAMSEEEIRGAAKQLPDEVHEHHQHHH